MANKKKPEVGSAEDRKLIQHYADEIKKQAEKVGGIEEAQRRLDLSCSIFYYHTLARKAGIDVEDFDKTVEYILKLFRDTIVTKGYRGLQRNMIPVVYYYGTIKDKAALCLQYFDYTRLNKGGKHPPIGKRTIDSLRQRIYDSGRETLREFVNYLAIYETYKAVAKHLYYVENIYFSTIFQTALYIQNYEWLTRTADLLTAMRPLITKTTDGVSKDAIKAFADVIDKQNDYLQSNQRFGELKVINDKVEDKEAINCLDFAKGMAEGIAPLLSNIKGIIEGLKEWTTKQEGKPFNSIIMPQDIREAILFPEEKLSINEVQDKYYKYHLKEMEKKGDPITDHDKVIAILPTYAEVEVDEDIKQQTIGKLNDTLQEKRR